MTLSQPPSLDPLCSRPPKLRFVCANQRLLILNETTTTEYREIAIFLYNVAHQVGITLRSAHDMNGPLRFAQFGGADAAMRGGEVGGRS